jgi:hypothetical protein
MLNLEVFTKALSLPILDDKLPNAWRKMRGDGIKMTGIL